MLRSEEDVRAKLVLPWLINRGFNVNDLLVEHSFSIRLGKSIFNVENGNIVRTTHAHSKRSKDHSIFRPRADVLVRNSAGKNLLVIEVKGPSETIDSDDDRDQGISYARLLLDGNIAPFVVLTNGTRWRIFNSITKDEVDGRKLNAEDICIATNFHPSCDDLSLRAEALQTLISLSDSNLVAFCEAQTAFRMRTLRSDDLYSGKKYIPSLYVERQEASKKLDNFLDTIKQGVIVLLGSPQVGKTNFVCHTVESRLRQDMPCLFYPAIGLKQSLLKEMAEDFEWVLGNVNDSNKFIHSKLRNILRRSGKKLVIFIDGWNEANSKLAETIDYDAERLFCDEIQIVITLTNVSACRLLGGAGGNPTFIAEASNIPIHGAQLIEIDQEEIKKFSDWKVVNIEKYTKQERDEAYNIYAEKYNVILPLTHKKVFEPYSLGLAMRLYQGSILPDTLDEPSLLARILEDKSKRAVGLERYDIKTCLTQIAKAMFTDGFPVSVETVSSVWGTPVAEKIPSGFFDSALLAQVTNEYDSPSIDFYYGRERDFIVAYWAQNWLHKVNNQSEIFTDFDQATCSNTGLDALRWFFKQANHVKSIQLNYGTLPVYDNPIVRRALLSGLCYIASRCPGENGNWLKFGIHQAINDKDNLAKIEAAKLVALLAEDEDDVISILDAEVSLVDFVTALLSVNHEFQFQTEFVGQIIIHAIGKIHEESFDSEYGHSKITGVLENVMLNDPRSSVREGAAACFGNAAPHCFLSTLSETIRTSKYAHQDILADYKRGISFATSTLGEIYYGSICPGCLQGLREDPELLLKEHENMLSILAPIISVYPVATVQGLIHLLEDLKPVEDTESDSTPGPYFDIYTLPLPFEETTKK